MRCQESKNFLNTFSKILAKIKKKIEEITTNTFP